MIWNLDTTHPERVTKPVQGLFRLVFFREAEPVETSCSAAASPQHRIREEVFYLLFVNWLTNELEDVTHAITLGGNLFKDRWVESVKQRVR